MGVKDSRSFMGRCFGILTSFVLTFVNIDALNTRLRVK